MYIKFFIYSFIFNPRLRDFPKCTLAWFSSRNPPRCAARSSAPVPLSITPSILSVASRISMSQLSHRLSILHCRYNAEGPEEDTRAPPAARASDLRCNRIGNRRVRNSRAQFTLLSIPLFDILLDHHTRSAHTEPVK